MAQAIKTSGGSREETARRVYAESIETVTTILAKAEASEELRGEEVHKMLDGIVRELTYENNELLHMACCQIPEENALDFIPRKMVNKTVLAVEIGLAKKFNVSKLFHLGMGALFADLGVVNILDIVSKEEVLKGEDLAKVRNLPYQTVEILKKIPDINQVVLKIAVESHERLDGSGPLGIREMRQLEDLSRIVAVIDVFEALTHDRPHRPRLLPHEAMRRILEEGGKFEEGVLRTLIDRIGLYPIGSWVRLTTKEIGMVIASNAGQPLRPRVRVTLDERGRPLEEAQLLDLSKNLSIQILQPVSDDDLKKIGKPNV